ncbi:hypothetical protein MM560_G819n1 [Manis javanica]|nr:hypothetical protein MM560_G819n1 [Manis javanica]
MGKPDISGPVTSKPITEEQRPEREAMKRRAQQERENAAKYTFAGKIQFFIGREKEMGIADLYGYIKWHSLRNAADPVSALGNSRNPKDPQPPPATKPWLNTPHEGKGLGKTHARAQKPDGCVQRECPSPSQDERPPPGKVTLVPLPFLTEDRPQARRVPRRPQSLASRRPALASSTRPGSTDAAQPTAVGSSRQASASLTGPACSSLGPVQTNSTQPHFTNSTQPRVTQSAASRPAPYRTSSRTSLQQEPIPTAVPQHEPPPKPQTQLPPQEFCFQPRPWGKPDISGPVTSKPITEEQRPEREAMKRRAQQERENAAKYTFAGKIQFFIGREKEMGIADLYGYIKWHSLRNAADPVSALGNSRNPKDPQPPPATKPWLNTPHEGKGLGKTHARAQKPDGCVQRECPSPSQDERPPPGKVTLVPLPFLTEDRLKLAEFLGGHSLWPHAASSGFLYPAWIYGRAQPTAVGSSRQASASLTGPACSSLGPVQTNSTQPHFTNSTQPRVTQSAASRPAPYRTSSRTSLQQEPIPTAVPPARASTQASNPASTPRILLPTPAMGKPDISGPVTSKPITEEQRPEREAMKRRAQRAGECCQIHLSWWENTVFIGREKEMELLTYTAT